MLKKDYKKILSDVFHECKWLIKYMRKYWWSITLYIFIGIVAILMGLGSSVASKNMIDVVVSHNKAEIVKTAILVIGLAVSQVIFQAISSLITSRVGTRVNKEIRSDFFDRIVHTNWEDISKYRSGDLINRIEYDIGMVSSGIVNFLPAFFTKLTQFVGSAIIVFYFDHTMAFIAILGAPVLMLTSKYMLKRIRKYNEKAREMSGKIISECEESIQNIQMIKSFGLTKDFSEKFKLLLNQYREARLEQEKFSVLTTMFMGLIGIIISYSCYGWGVWRLWNGVITFGTMTLFIQLSSTLTNSFNSLASLGPTLISIATSAGRMMELCELNAEKDDDADAATMMLDESENKPLEISAKNVSFTYKNSAELVIKNANFNVKSGETIAIIGPSGEGKTTLLRLILGLVNPTEGEITFSNNNCKLHASMSTRRLCSYVLQVNSILCGTVSENLRIVKPDATDEELINVLKLADAWKFVSKLPECLNAKIGERNINLSEGQAQRISIARALLRNSPVLLMDEATSSLDVETENYVLENIMNINPNQICILTTHRPSMLKYCSRIFKLGEDGSFKELSSTEKENLFNVES